MKELKVNKFITLKLEKGKTNIYLSEKFFLQCKYLLLNIDYKNINSFTKLDSIDEAAKELDHSLKKNDMVIPPTDEFWAHCSNLQVWTENNYDSRLIHSNLAFPLLKELYELRDPVAREVFKQEILQRFKSGYPSVVHFLISEGYIDILSKEDLDQAFKDFNYKYFQDDVSLNSLRVLEYLIDLGAPLPAVALLKETVLKLLENKAKDDTIITFLVNYDLMRLFNKEELESFQIKKIVLEEPFTNIIPSEIGFIKSIEELSIYLENMVLHLPDSIGNLINLRKLDLHGADDIERIPETIKHLKNLKFLSLPYYLSSIPDCIGNLQSLEELEISLSNLQELPLFIRNLKDLKILKVYSSGNLERPKWLKEMPNLSEIKFF